MRETDRPGRRTGGATAPAEPAREVIAGRQAVLEALSADAPIDVLYVERGEPGGNLRRILAIAKEKGIVIREAAPQKLEGMAGLPTHQGVVATLAAHRYAEVGEMLARAEEAGRPPLLVMLDGIEDPHNLGAIIRSAECAGADGVIIPKRRSASLTPTVHKAAAGALMHLPVARVANLVAEIERLKTLGFWVYGADMNGTPYTKTDLRGKVLLVIGGEGSGLSRLVREHCDGILSLPMFGKIGSLNASVAAGILLYEAVRQRMEGGDVG